MVMSRLNRFLSTGDSLLNSKLSFYHFVLVSLALHAGAATAIGLKARAGFALPGPDSETWVELSEVQKPAPAPAPSAAPPQRWRSAETSHQSVPSETPPAAGETSSSPTAESGHGEGVGEKPVFRLSAASGEMHPYFQDTWMQIRRASRGLTAGASQGSLQLKVLMIVEKNGKIRDVHVQTHTGLVSGPDLQWLKRQILQLHRFNPVPDEIALTDIEVVYQLNFQG